MMQMAKAAKKKTKAKEKPKERERTWGEIERSNPMAARESGMLNYASRTGYAPTMVQVPIEMSQLSVEAEDMFAHAGTHEMGAGIPPPDRSPISKSSSEAEFEPVTAPVSDCKLK